MSSLLYLTTKMLLNVILYNYNPTAVYIINLFISIVDITLNYKQWFLLIYNYLLIPNQHAWLINVASLPNE